MFRKALIFALLALLVIALFAGCAKSPRDGFIKGMTDSGVRMEIAVMMADGIEKQGILKGKTYEQAYQDGKIVADSMEVHTPLTQLPSMLPR